MYKDDKFNKKEALDLVADHLAEINAQGGVDVTIITKSAKSGIAISTNYNDDELVQLKALIEEAAASIK